jgi:hypothetical protein
MRYVQAPLDRSSLVRTMDACLSATLPPRPLGYVELESLWLGWVRCMRVELSVRAIVSVDQRICVSVSCHHCEPDRRSPPPLTLLSKPFGPRTRRIPSSSIPFAHHRGHAEVSSESHPHTITTMFLSRVQTKSVVCAA